VPIKFEAYGPSLERRCLVPKKGGHYNSSNG
jgi:hypothetical protein